MCQSPVSVADRSLPVGAVATRNTMLPLADVAVTILAVAGSTAAALILAGVACHTACDLLTARQQQLGERAGLRRQVPSQKTRKREPTTS